MEKSSEHETSAVDSLEGLNRPHSHGGQSSCEIAPPLRPARDCAITVTALYYELDDMGVTRMCIRSYTIGMVYVRVQFK